MEIRKIKGLIAAPFTPMKENGEINPELIPAYAKKLKTDAVKGVFICGTTGEGMLMTSDERKTVAEQWVKEQTEDFKVIVHVGTTSAKQSKDLANHAQKAGAYAVGTMGPVFLKPTRVEELVGFCAEVAAGAPELPFYYYHIPSVSGIQLPMDEFIRKVSVQVPNFAGLKFTHNNFMEMKLCMDIDNGKWDILHGFDELLLAGLAFGAQGAVGSTYNFMAPLYNGIIRDFENGNIKAARQKQALTIKVVNILNKYGGPITAGKALMKQAGVDCGPCRLPLQNLKEPNYKNFTMEIESIGVLNPVKSGE